MFLSTSGYMDIGRPDNVCQHCKSIMWNAERNNKGYKHENPTFPMCCRNGQVLLPAEQPPPYLAKFLSGGPRTQHYKKTIRI